MISPHAAAAAAAPWHVCAYTVRVHAVVTHIFRSGTFCIGYRFIDIIRFLAERGNYVVAQQLRLFLLRFRHNMAPYL